MKDIKIKVGSDDDNPQPLCCHCGEELELLNDHRSHLKSLYNLHVFSCPHCRKVIGISTVIK